MASRRSKEETGLFAGAVMCASLRDARARAGARKNVRCVGRKSRERPADAPKVVRERNRRRGGPGANFEHLAEAPTGMITHCEISPAPRWRALPVAVRSLVGTCERPL